MDLTRRTAPKKSSDLCSLSYNFVTIAFVIILLSSSTPFAEAHRSHAVEIVPYQDDLYERRTHDHLPKQGISLPYPGHQIPQRAPITTIQNYMLPGEKNAGLFHIIPAISCATETCCETKTATTCTTTTTSTLIKPATTWTSWSFSNCRINIGCSVTDSSSSTTRTGTVAIPTPPPVIIDYAYFVTSEIAINMTRYASINGDATSVTGHPPALTIASVPCAYQDQDPGQSTWKPYDAHSAIILAEEVSMQEISYNTYGYTTIPTVTSGETILPASIETAEYLVCSMGGRNNARPSLESCIPQATVQPPPSLPSLCTTGHAHL